MSNSLSESKGGPPREYRNKLLDLLWMFAQGIGLLMPPRVQLVKGKRHCASDDYQDVVKYILHLSERLPIPNTPEALLTAQSLLEASPVSLRNQLSIEMLVEIMTRAHGAVQGKLDSQEASESE